MLVIATDADRERELLADLAAGPLAVTVATTTTALLYGDDGPRGETWTRSGPGPSRLRLIDLHPSTFGTDPENAQGSARVARVATGDRRLGQVIEALREIASFVIARTTTP